MSLASPFENLNVLGRDKAQTIGFAAQTNDVSWISKLLGGGPGTWA